MPGGWERQGGKPSVARQKLSRTLDYLLLNLCRVPMFTPILIFHVEEEPGSVFAHFPIRQVTLELQAWCSRRSIPPSFLLPRDAGEEPRWGFERSGAVERFERLERQ